MPVAHEESIHHINLGGQIAMTTYRTAWLACALCAFVTTTSWGQTSTGDTAAPKKNISRQQREDSLKAEQARKSGEMGTQPSTPDLSGRPPTTSTNPVQRLQAALKAHGHDPGPLDGVMGQRTQEALRAYQKAQHLQATGRIDQETLDKLGVAGAAPRQP
jgi:peptidoglycan hydrolase-like protein with peptidoglycan-binding domain